MSEALSLELILSDEVRRLLDGFAAVMKIQAVIFTADGKIIKRGGNSENCSYCRLMQRKYFGVDRCRELDRKKREICAASGRIIHSACSITLLCSTSGVSPGSTGTSFCIII